MTITETINASIPPRIAIFPPTKDLPSKVRPIVTEYLAVYETLAGLAKAWGELTSPETIKQAAELDALAQAGAIRQGDTASSVGNPATDDLNARTLAAEQELVGAITATNVVAAEVRAALAEAQADDKTSGRAEALAAIAAYRQAAADMVATRQAALDALMMPAFISQLSGGGPDSPPLNYRRTIANPQQVGVWINPADQFNPDLVARIVLEDAEHLATHIPLP